MTQLPTSFHVVIAGGGISGLALALFLNKAGISCSIYEAYGYKATIGAGFNIAPNGMNVLDALGLAEKVTAAGAVSEAICMRNGKGKVIASLPNGSVEKYGQPGVSLSRAALYDILLQELKEQGLTVHYHKRLCDIRQTEDNVTAVFTDGTRATGDVLIGADGVHSATRQLLFPEAPAPAFTCMKNYGGFAPLSALPEMTAQEINSLNFTFGNDGFIGYCAAGNGMAMWWSNLPSDVPFTKEELDSTTVEEVKSLMQDRYKNYHAPIPALIAHTEKVLKVNVSDIASLSSWHKGRVLLIGDAAHAVSPSAGQGASMALEDAMYLGMLLRDAGVGSYAAAFRKFETDRKPRVEKIVAEGRKRSRSKSILRPWQAKIRDWMMAIFIPLFAPKNFDWLYRYKLDWQMKY
ncbi:FAD-dependent monooxygenase [Chitinophaga oryzae]|uniref:FAD-dependent monooxygenase n=1 Tax=Chitinophaga oryzae TaxID=2725414 RepID=A0ABX6LMJ7_9BACT|nr:FAD-dependent monooxygenase [Chitinophaga oryzae]QJB41372.1 FAD-dependent monooxygenase [Chitinophaga oryzae]